MFWEDLVVRLQKCAIWDAKDTNAIVTAYEHDRKYGISWRMESLPEIRFLFEYSFIFTWTYAFSLSGYCTHQWVQIVTQTSNIIKYFWGFLNIFYWFMFQQVCPHLLFFAFPLLLTAYQISETKVPMKKYSLPRSPWGLWFFIEHVKLQYEEGQITQVIIVSTNLGK